MTPSRPCPCRPHQHGAILITALVIFTVLMILGLASMQNTTLEERMAGNYRDRQLAFEAAEAGLRAGEAMVADDAAFDAMAWDGSDDWTFDGDPSLDPLEYQSGTDNYGKSVGPLTSTLALAGDPVYYVERLAEFDMPMSSLVTGFQEETPTIRFYRVTARGTGLTERTAVVLQSSYYR